ncbi:4'-phosphopantetheinyl transferase superfamily protein [Streptacidiphilus sp. PB12-B1b]|uniref:4'-phosphopantetheinyl transferase family protein n=1 Tax=Streptacidiphilus sp. PB12-B1b TaxID=2705012 RepID=UPI0015FA8B71|nr:4'-phosphopantetheinyl transferase superfamily protein [Streptacidiphilus sp. PB12-B1b]QMU75756.1 4'-phosphopantetheinyl transferase superfamily protein [Streptacidiphilus sp. PB12-B1b]
MSMERRPGHEGSGLVTVLWNTTDGDERSRARRLLLHGAAAELGVPASEIWVDHEPGGRPLLCGAASGLQVSVSHARRALAVALCGGAAVGVDAEPVRRLSGAALARAWLAPAEAQWVAELSGPEQQALGFLWLWTQKEAAGKALGRGLRAGGMSRQVALPEVWPPAVDGTPVLRPLPGNERIASGAALVDGGRLVLGVAAEGPGPVGRVALHRAALPPVHAADLTTSDMTVSELRLDKRPLDDPAG